jgi:predicted metal-dependent phosphoesterase TrpH
MPGTAVDMHVHTVRGAADSSLTPEQLIEEARRIGLSGVNIAEHDRAWDGYQIEEFRQRSGLFVSRGMEASTDMGHIIVVGLDRYVPGIRRAEELRRVIDEVGGFMIAAHPFRHFFDQVYLGRERPPPLTISSEEAVRLPIFALVDDVEVANGGCSLRENLFALEVARILGKPGIGGSDCHSTHGVGIYTTVFAEELENQEQMLALLRAGHYWAGEGLPAGELRPFAGRAGEG